MNFKVVFILILSTSALANPAKCGKYHAELKNGNSKITITSYATDWDSSSGYTDIQTTITGSISKKCNKYFEKELTVCDVAVKNVKLITDEDCFD